MDLDVRPKNQNHITPEDVRKAIVKLKFFGPIFAGMFAIIILGISAFFLFAERDIPGDGALLSPDIGFRGSISPTPFPFQELTIPFLRTQIYESELGEMSVVAENSIYTSYLTSYDSDGLKINGLLTVPKEAMTALIAPGKGFPAIIFVHGYIPPQNYQTTSNYADYVDYLARNGFVVFKIDLRGHGDSEGEPGGSYYSSDYIVDILNARAALTNYEIVAPKRIGLWGHSMAGNVIMRVMAIKPEIPAASIWAGAVYTYDDWEKYGIQDGSYRAPAATTARQRRRDELFETHGRFSNESEFWKQVAATDYLPDIQGAIQLNHSINDNVVNIGYSRDLVGLLDEAGVRHELQEYQSGGHNISGPAFNAAMQNTVRFFKDNL